MTWFKAPEGVTSVARSKPYPVQNGVFEVTDPADEAVFREQGFEVGAAVVVEDSHEEGDVQVVTKATLVGVALTAAEPTPDASNGVGPVSGGEAAASSSPDGQPAGQDEDPVAGGDEVAAATSQPTTTSKPSGKSRK